MQLFFFFLSVLCELPVLAENKKQKNKPKWRFSAGLQCICSTAAPPHPASLPLGDRFIYSLRRRCLNIGCDRARERSSQRGSVSIRSSLPFCPPSKVAVLSPILGEVRRRRRRHHQPSPCYLVSTAFFLPPTPPPPTPTRCCRLSLETPSPSTTLVTSVPDSPNRATAAPPAAAAAPSWRQTEELPLPL